MQGDTVTDRQTNIDADLFARVMALPSSLRHDVLKFIGATRSDQASDKSARVMKVPSEPAGQPFSKEN
jgi:hypothetical protein